MKKIFNYGYVVKGVMKNQYSSLLNDYWGTESFVIWPLRDFDDNLSKKLEEESWKSWFLYQIVEAVPSKEYLVRYINHCKNLGIETIIVKIETLFENHIVIDNLEVIEVLGYDCICGLQLSYLNLDREFMQKKFPTAYKKLNSNGLFNDIEDAYDFLDQYNNLLSKGENLEYGSNPFPVRLSIMKL